MARNLDELVRDFRDLLLDEDPSTFLAADALTMKVHEGGGQTIKIAVMVATAGGDHVLPRVRQLAVNTDGFREILGHRGHGHLRRRVRALLVTASSRRWSPAV